MKTRSAVVGCAVLLVALFMLWQPAAASATHAGANVAMYRGAGWTLALTGAKVPYEVSAVRGSLSYRGHRYHAEGDWIPAADAGGFLLRFYGHPFGNSLVGLVGVATLYNTCNPNCAAGRTFALTALTNWTLPGTQLHSVHLTLK